MNFNKYIRYINNFKGSELSKWYSQLDGLTKKQIQELIETFNNKPSITSINLGDKHIGPEVAIALAEVIKINSSLISVNLSYNNIGPEGAVALAEGLKSNSSITSIDLRYNSIGAEGAIALAEGIKINFSLTSINFKYNYFWLNGAKALAEAMKVNFFLTSISLGYNYVEFEEAALNMYKAFDQEITNSLIRNREAVVKLAEFLTKLPFEKVAPKDYSAFNFYQKCDKTLLKLNLLDLIQKDVTKFLQTIDNYIAKHWLELSGINNYRSASNHNIIILQEDEGISIQDATVFLKPLNLQPNVILSLIAEYFPKAFLSKIISGKDSVSYVKKQQSEASITNIDSSSSIACAMVTHEDTSLVGFINDVEQELNV